MAVVAIAGGTGSIGRTILEEVVADGKFTAIVLSRKPDPELEKTLNIHIVVVDYSDVDSLVAVLQDNNIGTVISALGGRTPPEQEINLIRAADESVVTSRYIPSVFGNKYRPEHSWFPVATDKLKLFDALEKTRLEWTAVSNGIFLDYWGLPKLESHLAPQTLVVDMAAKKAAIPGTGDVTVTFTYSRDVAEFVAKLLTLENWETESFIIGERLTWNEFVNIAEDVTGEKFDVVYDSLEVLKSGKITELPGHVPAYQFFPKEAFQGFFAAFGRAFHEGVLDFKPKQTLNELFPEIQAKTVREVIEIGWGN